MKRKSIIIGQVMELVQSFQQNLVIPTFFVERKGDCVLLSAVYLAVCLSICLSGSIYPPTSPTLLMLESSNLHAYRYQTPMHTDIKNIFEIFIPLQVLK